MSEEATSRPWYRHFWVWFLAVPPAATVIFWAFVLTTTASAPSLVVDDYSQIGLTYAQEKARDRAAAERGVRARLHLVRDAGTVTVALQGLEPAPDRLDLRLAHPTEARRDLATTMKRIGSGIYRGDLGSPADGRRYVQIRPADGDWRLGGELLAGRDELELAPPEATAAR